MSNKVSFIIQLKDQFAANAGKINRSMIALEKNAAKAARTIKNKLGKSLKGLRSTAVNAVAGIGVAFGVKELITRGAAFEDAMADMSSITGAAGEQLAFYTDESMRLAKASRIMQSEVAKAFTMVASGKSELLKTPEALSAVVEQALLLANAAGIEVPDAVRASVGSLNQFSKGADQAARFVNVIAASSKVGSSLVGDTAEALKNVGAVAAESNLSFEETNALIQVLAQSEIKGAEAGTKLRTALSKLEEFDGGSIAPSVIGIAQSLEELDNRGLSVLGVIEEFGLDAQTAIVILKKNVPLLREWIAEITGTTVAIDQADTRLATFNAKMRLIGITINEKVIQTFRKLAPEIESVSKQFVGWLDGIDNATFEQFTSNVAALAAALGALARAGGAVASVFGGVGRFFGEAAGFLVHGGQGGNRGKAEMQRRFGSSAAQEERTRSALGGRNGTRARPAPAAHGTVSGQITVSAEPGSKVTSTQMSTAGKGLELGWNMGG